MIKALLVEDNDVDAQLTQDLLSEWSIEEFQITRAKTLGEGLALLSRERFDAVLLDLSLPDAFGLLSSSLRPSDRSTPLVRRSPCGPERRERPKPGSSSGSTGERRITSSKGKVIPSCSLVPSAMPLSANVLKNT